VPRGRDPGAAQLCPWHWPSVPKGDGFKGTIALAPREPPAVVPPPQIPLRSQLGDKEG